MKWADEMVGLLIAELRRAGIVEAELRATWSFITTSVSGENSLELNPNCTKRKVRCQILRTNNNKDLGQEMGPTLESVCYFCRMALIADRSRGSSISIHVRS
jgi:hypothetical protein